MSYRYLSALATASSSARFRAALNALLALPLRWLKEGRHHSRIVREEYHQPNRGYVARRLFLPASLLAIGNRPRSWPASAHLMTTLETLPSLSAVGQLQPTTSAADGLRWRLRGSGDGDGYVDGGWWPRSLDLRVELPPLLAEVWSGGYDVFRVSYDLTAWHPVPPRRLIVSSWLVKLGGYRTQDPASISLVDSSGWKRLDLVVIPPQTDPVIAKRALAFAGLAGDLHRPGEILEQASRRPAAMISRTGRVDLLPEAEWETDGARTLAS